MNYIERVMGRINQLRGKLITEEDIKNCFDESDIVIDEVETGIYNVYSESKKGILQFMIDEVRLYDVYVYDYEEEGY